MNAQGNHFGTSARLVGGPNLKMEIYSSCRRSDFFHDTREREGERELALAVCHSCVEPLRRHSRRLRAIATITNAQIRSMKIEYKFEITL